jgi:hypothetical protein
LKKNIESPAEGITGTKTVISEWFVNEDKIKNNRTLVSI